MPLSPTYTGNDKFHRFKPDYQNRSLNCALKDSILTTDDVEIIQAYISEHGVVGSLGSKRILKITSNLITVKKILKNAFE